MYCLQTGFRSRLLTRCPPTLKKIKMNELISWLPLNQPRFVVEQAIGLLMGLERERNTKAKAGLRTLALTGLLGVLRLAAVLGERWLIATACCWSGRDLRPICAPHAQTEGGSRNNDGMATTKSNWRCCWRLRRQSCSNFKPELRGLSQKLSRRDPLSVLQFRY